MDLVDDSISFEIHNISVNVTTLNKELEARLTTGYLEIHERLLYKYIAIHCRLLHVCKQPFKIKPTSIQSF